MYVTPGGKLLFHDVQIETERLALAINSPMKGSGKELWLLL